MPEKTVFKKLEISRFKKTIILTNAIFIKQNKLSLNAHNVCNFCAQHALMITKKTVLMYNYSAKAR